MTETSAREIAAGLSEAQKDALLYGEPDLSYHRIGTIRALKKKGLATSDSIVARITPLGAAVRAILQEPKP